jgi:hypothetical protein
MSSLIKKIYLWNIKAKGSRVNVDRHRKCFRTKFSFIKATETIKYLKINLYKVYLPFMRKLQKEMKAISDGLNICRNIADSWKERHVRKFK